MTMEELQEENERLKANIDRLTSNHADHRYWEGRWRDGAAEDLRLRASLMPMLHLIKVFADGINDRNWADKALYIKQQVDRIRGELERQ